MTFNEANVNRDQTGKFGEKLGAAPEVGLADDIAAEVKRERQLIGQMRRGLVYEKGITDRDFETVESVKERLKSHPTPQLFEAVADYSEKLEALNMHSQGREIDALVTEAKHELNPEAPLEHPYAVMSLSSNADLVNRAQSEFMDKLRERYAKNGLDSETSETFARERADNHLVGNPNLDADTFRGLYGRVGSWRRAELLMNPGLPKEHLEDAEKRGDGDDLVILQHRKEAGL